MLLHPVLPRSWKLFFGRRGSPHARGPLRTPDEGALPAAALSRGAVFAALLAHGLIIAAILRLDPLALPASGLPPFAVPVLAASAPPRQPREALERHEEGRAPVSRQGEERRKSYFSLGNMPRNGLARDRLAQLPSRLARAGRSQDGDGKEDPRQVRRSDSPPAGTAGHRSRTFAMPPPAADGRDAANYQAVVGSFLERAKNLPASARKRGAKGVAKIGFAIDESGGVAGVSLLRSSGQGDLDAECIALIRRASPFPPPPAGAIRAFAIEVAFGKRT